MAVVKDMLFILAFLAALLLCGRAGHYVAEQGMKVELDAAAMAVEQCNGVDPRLRLL